jgi:hypothetical protein
MERFAEMLRRGLLSGITPVAVSAGLVVAPTFAGCADRAVAQSVQTRAVSCAGFDFHPLDSRTAYGWKDGVRYRTEVAGDGWFVCAAHLPHRAVVKQLRFTIRDIAEEIALEYCALVRTSLIPDGSIQVLAMVDGTSLAAKPGNIRRSDNSINFATVDDVNYAYSLQCQIQFDPSVSSVGPGTPYGGIIGASVTYTISAANG